jgi:hypothetical protein
LFYDVRSLGSMFGDCVGFIAAGAARTLSSGKDETVVYRRKRHPRSDALIVDGRSPLVEPSAGFYKSLTSQYAKRPIHARLTATAAARPASQVSATRAAAVRWA